MRLPLYGQIINWRARWNWESSTINPLTVIGNFPNMGGWLHLPPCSTGPLNCHYGPEKMKRGSIVQTNIEWKLILTGIQVPVHVAKTNNYLLFCLFLRAVMQRPRVNKDVFMFVASLRRSPTLSVFWWRSDPARSHTESLKESMFTYVHDYTLIQCKDMRWERTRVCEVFRTRCGPLGQKYNGTASCHFKWWQWRHHQRARMVIIIRLRE